MPNYKTVALGAMTVGLCFISYMLADGAVPAEMTPFENRLSSAHSNLADNSASHTMSGVNETVSLSENAVGNRDYTRAVATEATTRSYKSEDPKAGIHLQVLVAMQNQKVIEQNERIIALLERVAAARSK